MNNPLKIAKDLKTFAKVAKFCRIWSHWTGEKSTTQQLSLPPLFGCPWWKLIYCKKHSLQSDFYWQTIKSKDSRSCRGKIETKSFSRNVLFRSKLVLFCLHFLQKQNLSFCVSQQQKTLLNDSSSSFNLGYFFIRAWSCFGNLILCQCIHLIIFQLGFY